MPASDPSAELRREQETNLLLQETIADLELAIEDRSWERLSHDSRTEFSGTARTQLVELCRTVALANPLVKRGLMLRIAYIWGGGVQLQARDDKVQELVSEFWDDNAKSISSSQAQEELERALGTDGNVYLAAFTSPLTGRVQVRSTPADEICDIICNPDDKDEPWFYVREYAKTNFSPDTYGATTTSGTAKEVHPALGYTPATRVKNLDEVPVMWDAPMLHIAVNRLDGWSYGVPDVYASLAWARAYKDFLTDWALLTKSLAKFAWKLTGESKSRASKAIAAIRTSVDNSAPLSPAQPTVQNTAGQIAGMGPGVGLEAIPKSGANIDAGSGKPLAAMVAAGLGVSVVSLLADPGVTGARAVAETLDKPTVLEMTLRRMLWQHKLGELIDYVIDSSVRAPTGVLKGTSSVDDWGRRKTELAGNTERTVDWIWPALDELDPLSLVQAITLASEHIPAETTARLLLGALDVDNADEIIDDMRDDQGNVVPPSVSAGQAAADAFNAGKDPAAMVGPNPSSAKALDAAKKPKPGDKPNPKARESVLEADRVYHWKHGWIPLDHTAAGDAETGWDHPMVGAKAGDGTSGMSRSEEEQFMVGYLNDRVHFELSSALRSGTAKESSDQVRALDSLIGRAETAHPTTVYRGMAIDKPMPVGTEFQDLAYTSVTKKKDVAAEFAQLRSTGSSPNLIAGDSRRGTGGKPVTVEIRLPAGVHFAGGDPDTYEKVLERGLRYRVVENSPGHMVVEVVR